MRIVATIEARMTSTRLPGKVMLPIKVGVSMTEFLLKNISNSKYLTKKVIATTVNASDDILVEVADRNHISHFRGSESNVLKRVSDAHNIAGSDVAVLLTADNPFVTSKLIDEVVDCYLNSNSDFVTNSGPNRLYPDGLDVIAVNPKWLQWSLEEATDNSHFEHVCSMIYSNDKITKYFFNPSDRSSYAPDMSLTVDTSADFKRATELVKKIPADYSVEDLISAYHEVVKENAWE